MSFAQALPLPQRSSPRWLLFVSLALNLFFIGIAAALWVRGPAPVDRSVPARIERLAAALPSADAQKLRAEYGANRGALEQAHGNYERARETIRASLRREPFDPEAMRSAMTQTRAARQAFDQTLQNVIANASAQMSPEGRRQLADYTPPSRQPVR
ncbi:MAG: periplasmic heavy metal sensor [Pseudolabrys sp.]|nr:periplasmic heavy metal sensor [Pseudolabrys sp.]MBV9954764.1 periplasmic heavy metal sensor [Pseudolabrys sp.]